LSNKQTPPPFSALNEIGKFFFYFKHIRVPRVFFIQKPELTPVFFVLFFI